VLSFAAYQVLRVHVGGEAEWLRAGTGPGAGPPPSPARYRLRTEDAPLLAELARDGRAGVIALARATGWPPSRVSARVDELFAGGAIQVEIDLAPRGSGSMRWPTCGSPSPPATEATGRALSLHPETSFTAAVSGAANLMTAVNCRDADALYTYVTTKVGALPARRQAEIVPVLRRVKDGLLEPCSRTAQ